MHNTTTLIILLFSLLCAQSNQQHVSAIILDGNAVTQDHIILRELSIMPGLAYNDSLLVINRDRLYNLGIFERVAVYPSYQAGDSVIITVQVVETIRLLPAPIFYHRDDVGWSYGAGLSFLNFRGRNQRLTISGTVGGEKTYMLAFSDPWFLGDRISMSGLAARYFRDHPVYPFRSGITTFSATTGKWSSNKRVFSSVGLGYTDHQQTETVETNYGTSGDYRPEDPVHYKFIHATMAVAYQGTNVWRDPSRGIKANLKLTPHLGMSTVPVPYGKGFARITGSLAAFKSITGGKRPLVLAAGLRFRTNWGDIPNYGQNYLGGYWVRGYDIVPDRNSPKVAGRLEGKNVLASGLELRKTIMQRSLYLAAELGLSVVVFTEVGWAFGQLEALQQAQPAAGYGVGLRIFIPTVQAIAIDWGFNPYDSKRHVRFSLGQRF